MQCVRSWPVQHGPLSGLMVRADPDPLQRSGTAAIVCSWGTRFWGFCLGLRRLRYACPPSSTP